MPSIGRKQHLFLGVALSPLQRALLLRLLKIYFFPQKIPFSFMGNKILLPIPSQSTLLF